MQTPSESRRILELLAQGRIAVDDAEQLLSAAAGQSAEPGAAPPQRRWMRITIDKEPRDGRPAKQVTIRVPVTFLRSGAKLGAMFPWVTGSRASGAREPWADVDWSSFDFAKIEAALANAGEATIDSGTAHIRIAYE